MDINIGKRYQTLLVLWFAMLMNMVLLFVVTFIAAPDVNEEMSRSTSNVITAVLAAVGAFLVVISFVLKRRFLERSVDKQDVGLVQKGFVIAWAICEVSSIIGLLERFIIGNRDYYLLFIVAFIGTALHFPRVDHLKSASFNATSSRINFKN